MKKSIIQRSLAIVFTMFVCINYSNGQDAHFVQTYANPLRLNPAFMGANTDLRVIGAYRSQWSSIDKGYTTMSLTAMYPIFISEEKGKLDFGFNLMNDNAGAFSSLDVAFAANYNKQFSQDHAVSLSIMGGFGQKSVSGDKLTFDDQYVMGSFNSSNPTSEKATLNEKISYPDVGLGVMWYINPPRDVSRINAFFGISGFHLNNPNTSLTDKGFSLPRLYSIQAGVKKLGEYKVDFTPNIRINKQGDNVEASAGIYFDYNFNDNASFVIGTWYKNTKAVALLIGIDHRKFSFGYSYEMPTPGLDNVIAKANTHELVLSFKMSRLKESVAPASSEENGQQ